MIPRQPTEEDLELYPGGVIGPMIGRHLAADDIDVIRVTEDVYTYIYVPWVLDERDNIAGLREGFTVWTMFMGGMMPTDVVVR